MKKQIWVEEYPLNDYLKDGWTHVSNRDGALVYRTQKIFLYDVTYTDYYYLLEKEEVKDTIMPEENRMLFINLSGSSFEVCGTPEILTNFRKFIDKTNKKLFPKSLSMDETKSLAKDWGLKVINEKER